MQNKHLFMLIPSIIKLLQSPNIAEIASRLKHQEMAKMNARHHLSVLFCFLFLDKKSQKSSDWQIHLHVRYLPAFSQNKRTRNVTNIRANFATNLLNRLSII